MARGFQGERVKKESIGKPHEDFEEESMLLRNLPYGGGEATPFSQPGHGGQDAYRRGRLKGQIEKLGMVKREGTVGDSGKMEEHLRGLRSSPFFSI